MLSKENSASSDTPVGFRIHVLLLAMFAACVCWTVRADPPDAVASPAQAAPAARVARIPAVIPVQDRPFSHSKSEPWNELCPNDRGFVVIDLGTLFADPVLGDLLSRKIDLDFMWELIAKVGPGHKRADLGLENKNLKRLTATLALDLAAVAPVAAGEPKHSLSLGSDGGKVSFKQAVSHDSIRSAVNSERVVSLLQASGHVPDDLQGKTVVEYADALVREIFVDGATTDQLRIMSSKPTYDAKKLSRIQRGWNAVDGGVASICCSLPESLGSAQDPTNQPIETLLRNTACVGIGVDLPREAQATAVRVSFVPREGCRASDLAEDVRRAIEFTKGTVEKRNDLDQTHLAKAVCDAIATSQIRVQSGGPGEEYVLVTLQIPPGSILALISS